MPNPSIHFFEQYTHHVEFDLDGEKLIGELTITPSKVPRLQVHTHDAHILMAENRLIAHPLLVKELGKNKFFTLHDASLQRGSLVPTYITKGVDVKEIDTIEIGLTGISVWFERLRSYEISDSQLSRDIHIDKFNECFGFRSSSYSITNAREIESTQNTPTQHSINIQDRIVITKKTGHFIFNEIKDIAHQVRNLFSLLLGQSLSITDVYVMNSINRARFQSLHFLTASYKLEPLDNFHQSFSSFSDIQSANLWGTIIRNFFEKEMFRSIWNRLVPSFSQTGYWEYEILSVVVTLEMYCKFVSEGKGYNLSKNKYNTLKEALEDTLITFRGSEQLSEEDELVLAGVKSAISNIKNTSHPTLKQKYEYLVHGTNQQIKDAVDFTDENFRTIKKIRDSIAHGLSYKSVVQGEVTIENQIKDKLLVLLMYYVFQELGFSDSQIAKYLNHNLLPFVMNAGGNERARDLLAGTARFIALNTPFDDESIEAFKTIVVTYEQGTSFYTLDKELTSKTQSNWLNSGFRDVRDFVRNQISQSDDLEYINKLYLTNGDKEDIYYGVILVTR